ncbi:hypothetical protein SL053_002509 [Flavobacterium psychrophilum]|nr:hypothetical protein [Flavobacterium psychrophilum]
MQIEEIQKLKLSCLELATKTTIQESVSALGLAKSYFDWVNQENLDLENKAKLQTEQVPK